MSNHKRVVFYLVDGAHYDVINELLQQGVLPNIKKIIDEGSFKKAVTCSPSTTGPAYLPFLTGHFPGSMNIPGIRWFDKKEYKRRSIFNTNSMRSYCGPEAGLFNTDMPADKKTLFELLGRSYNLYNMITRNVPDEFDIGKKGKGWQYFRAHFYLRHHPVDELGHQRIMEMLHKGNDFDFLFAVFPSVDWDSHYHHIRDEKTTVAYQIADNSIGEVRAFLEKKGWWEDTLFIICSDHGLTPTHTHLDLGDWMTDHDYKSVGYPMIWRYKPKSAVSISGNSFGSIHLLDHDGHHALQENEIKKMMGASRLQQLVDENAVDFIAMRGDNANEYIVQNKTGRAIIQKNGTKLQYIPETADPLQIGKQLSVDNFNDALEATAESLYPDAIFQIPELFKSIRAGDIVVSAAHGHDLRDYWEIPEHKGSHGSFHKEHMQVPLISNQPGWGQGRGTVRTADLFSSILKWKGITGVPSQGDVLF